MMQNKKIAITGSIASGKSVCADFIREAGYKVFDSDRYAKNVYDKTNPNYNKIIELLGDGVLVNNEISYKAVANIIFSDSIKKKKLENIIHPYVRCKIEEIIKNDELFICEMALLFEAGFDDLFDYILVISCDDEVAIDRCIRYRNYSYEDAKKRIENQFSKDYKISKADYVIYNNSNIIDFKDNVLNWLGMMEDEFKIRG